MTRAADRTRRTSRRSGTDRGEIVIRAARTEDLATCGDIWRDGLNGYMVPLNLPPIPPDVGSVARLHEHLHSTDPDRFVVAARHRVGAEERLVGFASAVRREAVWFLSMLFVRPEEQGTGVGRALLDHVLPADDAILATATDTAQPISNALYAGYGMVPRMPLFSLIGRPVHDGAFEPLPAGVVAIPFEAVDGGLLDGDGTDSAAATIDAIDREVLGFRHPEDHRFAALDGRRGFLYRDANGVALGYGRASDVGRVGPIAVRDQRILPGVLGHLLAEITPRGASAVWVPGAAGDVMVALLRAGFRLDGFPVLVCWNRAFADFGRYLPLSPGLL